jgi:uncharacterized protein
VAGSRNLRPAVRAAAAGEPQCHLGQRYSGRSLEGGVLPSAAYVLTMRLWLPVGIHFAWDFSQDALVSANGLVRPNLMGPSLLSGGDSGIEGSILALLLCSIISAYLLLLARQRGHIVQPSWRAAR